MNALDHIAQIRGNVEMLQKHLQDFADDHLNEGWLESPWKRLMDALDAEEPLSALDELEREYQRLKFSGNSS